MIILFLNFVSFCLPCHLSSIFIYLSYIISFEFLFLSIFLQSFSYFPFCVSSASFFLSFDVEFFPSLSFLSFRLPTYCHVSLFLYIFLSLFVYFFLSLSPRSFYEPHYRITSLHLFPMISYTLQ